MKKVQHCTTKEVLINMITCMNVAEAKETIWNRSTTGVSLKIIIELK